MPIAANLVCGVGDLKWIVVECQLDGLHAYVIRANPSDEPFIIVTSSSILTGVEI